MVPSLFCQLFGLVLPSVHLLLLHHLLLNHRLLIRGLFNSVVIIPLARIGEREVLGSRSKRTSCLDCPVGSGIEEVRRCKWVSPRMWLSGEWMFPSVSHLSEHTGLRDVLESSHTWPMWTSHNLRFAARGI